MRVCSGGEGSVRRALLLKLHERREREGAGGLLLLEPVYGGCAHGCDRDHELQPGALPAAAALRPAHRDWNWAAATFHSYRY